MFPTDRQFLRELLDELAADNTERYRQQLAIKSSSNVIDGRERFEDKIIQDAIDKFNRR